MTGKTVTFMYIPGVFGSVFPGADAVLEGSWNKSGHFSDNWTTVPMTREQCDDGGICFKAQVKLDSAGYGMVFKWGVRFHWSGGKSAWAIATEISEPDSKERYRTFRFDGSDMEQRYYLTSCRRLGANKYRRPDGSWGVRFAVWAPNAVQVALVFGSIWDGTDSKAKPAKPGVSLPKINIAGGYIADDGFGIHPDIPPVPMKRTAGGIWETLPDSPALQGKLNMLNHRPYMFRITQEDGFVSYRSDLYSRCQIGSGSDNPRGGHYTGRLSKLDGSVSCSVTVNPEEVTETFDSDVWPEQFISDDAFWKSEFTGKKIPESIRDLIIYELHVGALGFGSKLPGTLKNAIDMLDYLQGLHVNAVELLPLSEFGGGAENWGYATSHYFAIEYGGGGRDQFKYFIRECHRRGMAVIMDVVYNHYDQDAERAEFNYDSPFPEHNIYYWYEGRSSDYTFPEGGYVDNMSTGWAPRYCEEMVRQMFISSAVSLLQEFHVDGFRVDQTTSIHGYNVLHADGSQVGMANRFGAKFLRELGRTLRMFRPGVFLMAEDHSDWNEVVQPVEDGGMGFDARWYSMFYHHLSGDTDQGDTAKLLYTAAVHPGQSLHMDWFSGALAATQYRKVVYNESHDEAGNSTGPFFDPDSTDKDKKYTSHRGIVVASNAAPLVGDTRKYAEARCRFAWGVTVLSAGIPMFLFGEEVGAERRFKYNAVLDNKEDYEGMAAGSGSRLYRFYSDVNALRAGNSGLRSTSIDIVYVHNDNRIIAFRRRDDRQTFLIVGSLADHPFADGYVIHNDSLDSGTWREIFNSDADVYGGDNIGSGGQRISCTGGIINVVIPFAGFVVLAAENQA